MKLILLLYTLIVFGCMGNKPIETIHLIERGGLVYYKTPYSSLKSKDFTNLNTPFNGEAIKYYPTGEVELKGTFKNGVAIKGIYYAMDGSILEESEVKGDTTTYIEWFGTGQKRWEEKKISSETIFINRWNDDGTIRLEPFDWEKKVLNDESLDIPLSYIIKKPLENIEKPDVLFFMHGNGGNIGYYQPKMINQFGDKNVRIILKAPYESYIYSNKWTWFDAKTPSFSNWVFNEKQINESCKAILLSIDKIIKKEQINPKRVFVGGHSQGGIMACKLALEYPDVIDGFIAHNSMLPINYKTKEDKSIYLKIRGLVINGKNDKRIDPIHSKQIVSTFRSLRVNIQSEELNMGHDFPKASRDIIRDWIASE